MIEYRGKFCSAARLAEELGVGVDALINRYARGARDDELLVPARSGHASWYRPGKGESYKVRKGA